MQRITALWAGALVLVAAGLVLLGPVPGAGWGPQGGTRAALLARTTNEANRFGALYVQAPIQHPATSGAAGSVHLSWDASPTGVDREIGYLVFRAPAESAAYSPLTPAPLSHLTYDDTPPHDGYYTYVIR